MPGIVDLVGLAFTVALALPMALFGAEALAAGDPLGAAYVGLAALLVVLGYALTTPDDVPGRVLQWAVGRVVRTPEEDRNGGPE